MRLRKGYKRRLKENVALKNIRTVCFMDKEKRKSKSKTSLRFDSSSKFWKTFLVILAAFLTFVGPTYMVYLLLKVLDLSLAVSMISGFILFVAGLALILYLIKHSIIA
jgi:hypothetical protein